MQHIQKIVTKIARIKNVTFTNGHSFTLCDKDATAWMQQLACVVPIHAKLMAWNIYPGYFAVSVAQNNKLVNKMKPCCNSESAYNILYELAIDAMLW